MVAQLVERTTPGQQIVGLISVGTLSLLLYLVSV